MPLEAYVAEIDRLAAFLGASTPAAAEAMSSSLAPRWIVSAGGEQVAVDTRWLVEGLRAAEAPGTDWPHVRERLRRRLLALRMHAVDTSAGVASGSLHPSFRTTLASVLADPEFRAGAAPDWRERLQRRIGEWLQSLLRRIGFGEVEGRAAAMAFAWIAGIAALTGLGLWLARTLAAGPRAVSFGRAPGQGRRVPAREWAVRAKAALGEGNTREAVRCAYRAALRRMEDEGAWRLDESRTPREYLRMLEPHDSRRPAVKELTELFELAWYGNRVVDERGADRLFGSLERLGCLDPNERAI